jgi:hypothetical protein
VFQDRYRRLGADEFAALYREQQERLPQGGERPEGVRNVGQHVYWQKFNADFSKEMTRSVRAILRVWLGEAGGRVRSD